MCLDLSGLLGELFSPPSEDLLLLADVLQGLILREFNEVVTANLHHDLGEVLTREVLHSEF